MSSNANASINKAQANRDADEAVSKAKDAAGAAGDAAVAKGRQVKENAKEAAHEVEIKARQAEQAAKREARAAARKLNQLETQTHLAFDRHPAAWGAVISVGAFHLMTIRNKLKDKVNVGVLAGLGYLALDNWHKRVWDRQTVTGVVGGAAIWYGLVGAWLGEQYDMATGA